ncbi:MAG TPA: NAD(P)-dependent oxidoreductase, partial [Anaerolineales bacterium]|nr:NAD(P)-dependent oxidoreductase [Anaerolineales bacterium]
MKKILVTLTKKEQAIAERVIREFSAGKDLRVVSVYSAMSMDRASLLSEIGDTHGYLFGLESVDEELFSAAKTLKVVCKHGVGVDNVDKAAAARHGVAVTNCPGQNSNAVAELTLGLMIALARDIPQLDADMKRGICASRSGSEISGKTLGIIGMGAIGKLMTRYAKAFGMTVLAYDVVKDERAAKEYEFEYTEIDRMLREADYVSLHVPLTDATRGLIDRAKLRTMKKTAYVINAARGGVIVEDDLYDALIAGEIAGAAIDSFQDEPPTGSRLLTTRKV